MMTCQNGLSRANVVSALESGNIQTRMLFAGNLLKHPCFDEMRRNGSGYRTVNDLPNTDRIMNESFWVGVYPGMTEDMLSEIARVILAAAR